MYVTHKALYTTAILDRVYWYFIDLWNTYKPQYI